MKTNTKIKKPVERLAGGSGAVAAQQSYVNQLKRAVMSCLLWENIAYESGDSVASNIAALIPKVSPEVCAQIAIDARVQQKLRHVPLFIVREMCRYPEYRKLVDVILPQVINRPDEITEFMSLYWREGRCPIAKKVKIGLAKCFNKFDRYQIAKWNKKGSITLRDVMFLVHPKPQDPDLFKDLANNTLEAPETWEVGLSQAGSDQIKKQAVWRDLLAKNKLGALALLKNLRGMSQAGLTNLEISQALNSANSPYLLPIDFLRAVDNCPAGVHRALENMMFRSLARSEKLPGRTIFVLDVSGSMGSKLSAKTDYGRIDAGIAMAILAMEICEDCVIYLTAGSDTLGKHKTVMIEPQRGFGLRELIRSKIRELGGGGIFTRQCLEYIKKQGESGDRTIVFSDSQDCDRVNKKPAPFTKYNYIIDVSSHKNGINYQGVWTAEISGWSEHFLRFIAELERANYVQ